MISLLFVGAAILEFAFLLRRRQSVERKYMSKSTNLRHRDTAETIENEDMSKELNIFEKRQREGMELNSQKMEKQNYWSRCNIIRFKYCTLNIDSVSQFLFLFVFILFNIMYWCYYLTSFYIF